MNAHDESYEFDGIGINKKSDESVRVDVILDAKEYPFPKEQQGMGILFMGADEGVDKNGNELGHKIRTWIRFKDEDNLKLAQMGLEMIEQALYQDELI